MESARNNITVTLKEKFGIDNLEASETETPSISSGEILVRMRYASLNYLDLLILEGAFGGQLELPFVPVCDGAGEVLEIGSEVDGFEAGDRVATVYIPDWRSGSEYAFPPNFRIRPGMGGRPGALQRLRTFKENELIRLPAKVDLRAASTLPIAGVTAWRAIQLLGLEKDDNLLIHGSGSVACIAIELAKLKGIRATVTTTNPSKKETLLQLGASRVVVYHRGEDWRKGMKEEIETSPFQGVLETIGGSNLMRSIESLAFGGGVVTVGFLEGTTPELDLIPFNLREANIYGSTVGSYDDFEALLHFVGENDARIPIDSEFSLKDVSEAFRRLKSGQQVGKIVINLDDYDSKQA